MVYYSKKMCAYRRTVFDWLKHRSRALKSRSKLRAAIGLRAAFGNYLLHENKHLFTFGEKVPTLAKSRGS